MSDFLQRYRKASSEDAKDQLLKDPVRKILDQKSRERWSDKLMSEYGISKASSSTIKTNRRLWIRIVSVAAGIAMLIALLPLFETNSSSEQHILSLVQSQPIAHPGVTKGIAAEGDVQLRADAISRYNDSQYAKAAEYFGMISEKTTEDQFFQATSDLYASNYEAAINLYRDLQTEGPGQFRQEINWFLALALILDGQKGRAKIILESIGSDEWHANDAKEILDDLR
ncbi:MAG: hypothetical protein HKN87_19590 [Saprospiraceae bacterium]|nr:hypothetical protein [Saprospiraceae bacterium]